MKIITTILYLLYMITYLQIYLGSPGIAGKEYYSDTFKVEKEEDKLNYQICTDCNIIIPKSFKVVHCDKCNICVIKQDHHCPWTGKCIGKKNISERIKINLATLRSLLLVAEDHNNPIFGFEAASISVKSMPP